MDAPAKLDLKKDKGLTVEWADGTTSYYTIAYLRKMSPSADVRQLRDEMAKNPLTVLPASQFKPTAGSLVAVGAELVGNYAIKIRFSDGHDTGIYSWGYLRQIDPDPDRQKPREQPPGTTDERTATGKRLRGEASQGAAGEAGA